MLLPLRQPRPLVTVATSEQQLTIGLRRFATVEDLVQFVVPNALQSEALVYRLLPLLGWCRLQRNEWLNNPHRSHFIAVSSDSQPQVWRGGV